MPRVVFFQIRSPQEKLLRLAETAAFHFERKEHLILFVEDEKAAQFVDDFLWKFPESSFLPHVVSEEAADDYIVIRRVKKNIGSACFAFNLCPTPLFINDPLKIIYDFDDSTSPNKKQFSELRFEAYKKSGSIIESRT